LADLREHRRAQSALDPGKTEYTKTELAALLGIKPSAVTALVRRHRLEGTGNGKARRYPRTTAEALCAIRHRGRSIKTSNLYLDAIKGSGGWRVEERRVADNPLAHLAGGNVKRARRHARRALTLDDLRAAPQASLDSRQSFKGLTGPDRHILY